MAKDEIMRTRDEARGGRRAPSETAESLPLVSAKRGKFQTVEQVQVEALLFARLEDYKAFIVEVEGEEPEAGAIISAGLEMLFDADRGFERWVLEQRRKGRNGAPAAAHGKGSKGSTTAVAPGAAG